ncbi:MAG: tRNA (N6-threonylcarbamoyladenosine(37)-N6)-methyltransferase TrmO, partial [Desulfobacterales bacterium]|nr:tRNA (N6-threonylcarbamoyladenosine(37)-N6)-methyltransferase TrmO [Desulfobacterales bacterium]
NRLLAQVWTAAKITRITQYNRSVGGSDSMTTALKIFPVGTIHSKGQKVWIDVLDAYTDALLGLEGFSHINVLFWFHQNDTPEKRRVVQVHPRNDPSNPLTGVFGTHSPMRPNLIGLTPCKIISIEGNRITLDGIDASDGSPVIDIKGFIPSALPASSIRVPKWV